MSVLRVLRYRLRAIFRGAALDRDLAEEMRLHVELAAQAHEAAGWAPTEARRRALLEFGGVAKQQEAVRDARGVRWQHELWQDLRYGLRLLRKSPVFTAVAVASIGLGVGVNSGVFSLVNAVLLSSLPVPHPEQLRVLKWTGSSTRLWFSGSWQQAEGELATADAVSYPVFEAIRERSTGRAEVFGFYGLREITVQLDGAASIGNGVLVSDNYFEGLGVGAALGRVFSSRDDGAESAGWIVLSHGWWQQAFGGAADVLGKTVSLNQHTFTVIGVLPPAARGLPPGDAADFYVAMGAQPALAPTWTLTEAHKWWLGLMARLEPGVGEAQFLAAADAAFRSAAGDLVEQARLLAYDGRARQDREYYQGPLLILLAIVSIVVLVACANLAALSLARAVAREHEFAARRALGASRGRLLRQSLTESLLLGAVGAAIAIPLAAWTTSLFAALMSGTAGPLPYDVAPDVRVLAYTMVLALTAALLAGSVSAYRSATVDPGARLHERGAARRPRLRAARMLMVVQVALSIVLVTAAGLYGRTLYNLYRIDPGFQTERLLLFHLNPSAVGYGEDRLEAFYDDVASRLAALPGVRGVTLSQHPLLSGVMSGGGFFTIPDHPPADGERPMAHRHTVSESYFSTMAIPLVLGRPFRTADAAAAPGVVLINETFGNTYFAGSPPLGQRVRVGDEDFTVIGVARDARYTDIKADVPPTMYFSFRQSHVPAAFFAVRTAGEPLSLLAAARAAVSRADTRVPLARVATQEQLRDQRIAPERTFAFLCGALAGLALLLCCIGLYGVIAYNVSRRTGEFGVRVALGATRRGIAGQVAREAAGMVLLGVGLGLPLALAAVRVLQSQLYGVKPLDPPSLAAGVALLAGVAVLAAWLPARRAASIDPADALRAE